MQILPAWHRLMPTKTLTYDVKYVLRSLILEMPSRHNALANPPTSQPSHAELTPYLYSNKHMDPADPQKYLKNYSRFFRRLALSLPHAHRPTREDFLNVATGFWQRLRIRFKWFTIKSFRKFNADDISAFVTWFLMSQTLWILVGT